MAPEFYSNLISWGLIVALVVLLVIAGDWFGIRKARKEKRERELREQAEALYFTEEEIESICSAMADKLYCGEKFVQDFDKENRAKCISFPNNEARQTALLVARSNAFDSFMSESKYITQTDLVDYLIKVLGNDYEALKAIIKLKGTYLGSNSIRVFIE